MNVVMIHLVLPTESVFFWDTVFASLSIARKFRALQSGIGSLCFYFFFHFDTCGEKVLFYILLCTPLVMFLMVIKVFKRASV